MKNTKTDLVSEKLSVFSDQRFAENEQLKTNNCMTGRAMSKNEQFEYESFQDNDSISKYLQALIQGFEKGKLTFSSDLDNIVLEPNGLLQFGIKARKKGSKNKLSIKISWKDSKKKDTNETIFINS
ncbi:amphi-Trp domain-containing protein [Desulfonema magnum]|nr:amphi-Trp domain-containing protein [Desulfonema magnum]